MVEVKVRRLRHASDIPLPDYASDGAAGADLRAAVDTTVVLGVGERFAIPTGMQLEIPQGYEAQLRPRSGLAIRHGVTVVNAPGTIDADYRGELKVLLINHGDEAFVIHRGDRIAQLVLAPVSRATFRGATELADSERGDGGFGSTGSG